ncbi:lyase family protein [Actinoplanes sp. NPDC051494]|uniref:lyase family protein n=1 Tax=Actinoplanes sp. NPDC051494 TaxID=3363907 RepID=UPI0037AA7061
MTGPVEDLTDSGLLSPVRAGTAVEAVTGDRAWLQAMLDAEAALARAQARLGTLPRTAAEVITRAARADDFDLRGLAVAARETANPVVAMVRELTRAVATLDPAAAEYVHRGSTSQDIMDTGAMLVTGRALDLITGSLDRVAAALGALAREHRDTAMAGRTLGLHAVPTTFGLKVAGWREQVVEAGRRTAALRAALPVSLGGAAGTLAGYLEYAAVDSAGPHPDGPHPDGSDPDGPDPDGPHPDGSDPDGPNPDRSHPDRSRSDRSHSDGSHSDGSYPDRLVDAFAAETGLRRPVLPWHTLRAPVADVGSVLAFVTGVLGKIAVDVLALSRTEVGEVVEPAAAGRGASSAMPHKRNPVLATLIRSAALQVPLLAAGLAQALLSDDERAAGVWQSEWSPLRECLRLSAGAAETAVQLAEGLGARPERMRANLALTRGQVVSERVVAVLTPLLGRAVTRELLDRASHEAARSGRDLSAVLAESPELTGRCTPAELAAWCDPARYLGAAPHLVDRALG